MAAQRRRALVHLINAIIATPKRLPPEEKGAFLIVAFTSLQAPYRSDAPFGLWPCVMNQNPELAANDAFDARSGSRKSAGAVAIVVGGHVGPTPSKFSVTSR
jgi:hypothetical protein